VSLSTLDGNSVFLLVMSVDNKYYSVSRTPDFIFNETTYFLHPIMVAEVSRQHPYTEILSSSARP
jgi:hypothetical protein